jgi:hypothetical protein
LLLFLLSDNEEVDVSDPLLSLDILVVSLSFLSEEAAEGEQTLCLAS